MFTVLRTETGPNFSASAYRVRDAVVPGGLQAADRTSGVEVVTGKALERKSRRASQRVRRLLRIRPLFLADSYNTDLT